MEGGSYGSKLQLFYLAWTMLLAPRNAYSTQDLPLGGSGVPEIRPFSGACYHPFGMMMPGRRKDPEKARYAFQGQEQDLEMKGFGNSYNFGARIQDPRVGGCLSVDFFAAKFPNAPPYTFSGNSPVFLVDESGETTDIHFQRKLGRNFHYLGDYCRRRDGAKGWKRISFPAIDHHQ